MTTRRLSNSLVLLVFTLGIPTWLVLTGTRLLASEAYLDFAYSNPAFPPDPYGFTMSERRAYAPHALYYLLGDDENYLAAQTFPDGTAQYNARELRHMADVRTVMQIAFGFHTVLTLLLLGNAIWLARQQTTRRLLRRGLHWGGMTTLAGILALALVAILNWDYFFNSFHTIFFESGTWRFEYSDTLIRLFPEPFWFNAVLTIGLFTIAGAALLVILAWYWERTSKAAASADTTA